MVDHGNMHSSVRPGMFVSRAGLLHAVGTDIQRRREAGVMAISLPSVAFMLGLVIVILLLVVFTQETRRR